MSRKIDKIKTWVDIFPDEMKRMNELPHPEGKKIILITGTGRCGTGFLSNVFQNLGLDFGHEGARVHGQASYKLAPFFEQLRNDKRFLLITVIRNEGENVRSIMRQGYFHPRRFLHKAFQKVCPVVLGISRYYDRVRCYRNYWNNMALIYSDIVFSIEELGIEQIEIILKLSGHSRTKQEIKEAIQKAKTNSNKHKKNINYDEVFEVT